VWSCRVELPSATSSNNLWRWWNWWPVLYTLFICPVSQYEPASRLVHQNWEGKVLWRHARYTGNCCYAVHKLCYSFQLVSLQLLTNVNSHIVRYMSWSVRHLSSVTFVHPTQAIEIFGNVSTPFGTLAISDLSIKFLRRSSQGNRSGWGLNQRGVAKYSDIGPFQGYISETVQDRR